MIIGCVIFFNDGPELLESCLSSLSKVCDKIIAVDGAFAEFPNPSRMSKDGCLKVAEKYADKVICAPGDSGWADQITKRNAYLKEAEKIGKDGDYILMLDADEVIEGKKPSRLKEDFYTLKILTLSGGMILETVICRLFRLYKGIRYSQKHNSVLTQTGVLVNLAEVTGLPLVAGVSIHHTPELRGCARLEDDGEYLRNRKENLSPTPSIGPASLLPVDGEVPKIPLKVLERYHGYSNECEELNLFPGSVVRVSPETAARLLLDFPTWFKEGE